MYIEPSDNKTFSSVCKYPSSAGLFCSGPKKYTETFFEAINSWLQASAFLTLGFNNVGKKNIFEYI